MLRDIKAVRNRVAVLPTLTQPSGAPGHPKLIRTTPQDTKTGRDRNTTASLIDKTKQRPASATGKPAAATLSTKDKPEMPAGTKPTTTAARLTEPLNVPSNTRRAWRWVPVATCLIAVGAGCWLYRDEVANHFAMTILPATRSGDDLTQVKRALQQQRDEVAKLARQLVTARHELGSQAAALADNAAPASRARDDLTQIKETLRLERDKVEQLNRELTTAWRELRSQAAALTDNAAQIQELTDLRQALHQTELQSAAYQEFLAQERTRNRELEEQVEARREAPPSGAHNVIARRSNTPDPTQASVTDKAAGAPLPTSDKLVMPAGAKPASTAPRPVTPEALGNPEVAPLMARASLLLGQGNIGSARIVLERAAEIGSAVALFALAETYDPFILSAWGTLGTRSDAAKARELYAKAFAGGIQEAKDRLNTLRQ